MIKLEDREKILVTRTLRMDPFHFRDPGYWEFDKARQNMYISIEMRLCYFLLFTSNDFMSRGWID